MVFFFYLTRRPSRRRRAHYSPCSHKSHFDYPRSLFYPESYTEDGYNDEYFSTDVPEGVLNVTPKAGDVVIISELVTHGALSWVPEDRDRRFLTLRYMQQHESVRGSLDCFSPEVRLDFRRKPWNWPHPLPLPTPRKLSHKKSSR